MRGLKPPFCRINLQINLDGFRFLHACRLRREMRQREEREERELEEERERLRELERFEREQAALRKPKPWELKHKKKRANYCGKLQKWN